MARHKLARNLSAQKPGRENRYASYAAGIPNLTKTRGHFQTGGASNTVRKDGQESFSHAVEGHAAQVLNPPQIQRLQCRHGLTRVKTWSLETLVVGGGQ